MLNKNDKLKSRVLMAKAQIPHYQIVGHFTKKFPEWVGKENLLTRYFNLMGADLTFTEQLESWAKEFDNAK